MNHPRAALCIIGLTLALIGVYQFVYAEHPVGLAFAVMVVALLGASGVAMLLAGQKGNRWSLLFLIPLCLSTLAKVLYASSVVQFVAFLVAFCSLVLFVFWNTSPPISFWHTRSLWPTSFFIETLWPFQKLKRFASFLQLGHSGWRVLVGFAIAIPFLAIFAGLFMSSDLLLSRLLTEALRGFQLQDFFGDVIRDAVLGVIFLATGWTMFLRRSEQRLPIYSEANAPELHAAGLLGFLLPLVVLFLCFIVFQAAAAFGGESFVQSHGLTYAEYARSGFFQLLAVAGIVFAVCVFVYRSTNMRDGISKWLTIALIGETGVIIFSAVKRLQLYIETYGLTLARWWPMVTILFIGGVLLLLAVLAIARVSFHQVAKILCMWSLTIVSVVLLFNVEGSIVAYNANRFLAGKTNRLDVGYMVSILSDDAIPQLIVLSQKEWPTRFVSSISKQGLLDALKNARIHLSQKQKDGWRSFLVSDYWARTALSEAVTQ